ncbi:hypothetical protein ACIA6C_27965 [Streptomyces sp. NPDC051578]|uniref:hypothetical protein n=1 Tax=Streptomyces sp. NPDC051578 TaxID=3365662 RepID=UPI0037AEB0C3
MTADPLRDAIAADCPHRLDDYDQHLAGRQLTPAFQILWRMEHRISSSDLEQKINDLYRRAEASLTREEARSYFEQVSQIRNQVKQEVIKEMGDE